METFTAKNGTLRLVDDSFSRLARILRNFSLTSKMNQPTGKGISKKHLPKRSATSA